MLHGTNVRKKWTVQVWLHCACHEAGIFIGPITD